MQRGLVTALRAEGRAVAAALQEQSAALSSDRAGLTREAVEAEQATELLLTAEGMLSAQPESHAVSCSHVEVGCLHISAPTLMFSAPMCQGKHNKVNYFICGCFSLTGGLCCMAPGRLHATCMAMAACGSLRAASWRCNVRQHA